MRLLILTLTLCGAILLSAGPAFGTHLECGDVVVTDVTLDSDLLECAGHGLVVGAQWVDINLNGHVIDGEGPPIPFVDPFPGAFDWGIYNPGFTGFTVVGGKGGRISGFHIGIRIEGATLNSVSGLDLTDNTYGVSINTNSTKSRIVDNVSNGNYLYGIEVRDSSDIEVSGNVLNVLSLGTTWRTWLGIAIENASNNLIQNNTISGSLVSGISVDGRANRVLLNDVIGSSNWGIEVRSGRANIISRNAVEGTSRFDGITIGFLATLTTVDRNLVVKNGDDGIDANSRSTRLGKNVANGNGDLGIEAVPGVTDLGDNEASGNGDPRQCTNVVCTT